jgi:DNA polymerase III delta subunit-like protein
MQRITPPTGQYLVSGHAADTQSWVSAWVAKHFCESCLKEEKACGLCPSCRCFAEGSHPDYLAVSPDKPGGQILLDAVRNLIQFVSLTPKQARSRVIVMTEADRLNLFAANAFLKTLEEPISQSVLMILTTERPRILLDTIRSRCVQIRLPAHKDAVQRVYRWTAKDRQVLQACQEVWEAAGKLCKVVDMLLRSLSLEEVLYSLWKMGYAMSRALEGLSAREQVFLAGAAEQLGMNLWLWIDRVTEDIQSIYTGISLNAPLLLESLFIALIVLRRQGRQVLDGKGTVSYG